MKQYVMSILTKWSSLRNQRLQMQHFYLAAAAIGVVSAGLIGLLNYNLGQRIVTFSLLSLAIYIANAVVWTLLNALVVEKLERKQAAKTVARKKSTPKRK